MLRFWELFTVSYCKGQNGSNKRNRAHVKNIAQQSETKVNKRHRSEQPKTGDIETKPGRKAGCTPNHTRKFTTTVHRPKIDFNLKSCSVFSCNTKIKLPIKIISINLMINFEPFISLIITTPSH